MASQGHGLPGVPCRVVFLASLLCLQSLGWHQALAFSTRGMSPEDKARYAGQDTFTCKDSGEIFPVAKLNDDFCDCADGTDEPGTSACPNGSFYCANKGHVPLQLHSSRINDGICDCCDGSDEFSGWVKCEKTCAKAGEAARKELEAQVAKFKEGVRLRDQAVSGAQEKRQQWTSRLAELEGESKELEETEKKLREEKEAVEKKEQEEREWREKMEKEQEERERVEKEGQQPSPSEGEAPPVPSEDEPPPEAEGAVELSSEEEEERAVAELEAAGHTVPEDLSAPEQETPDGPDGDEDLSGLSKEEMGRRIAERWTGGGGVQHSDEPEAEAEDVAAAEADAGEGMAVDDEDLASLSKDEMGRKVAERWTGHTESVYKDDEEEGPDEDEPDYPHDDDEFRGHEHDPHQDEGPPPDEDFVDESSSPDVAVSPRATWWARMLQWPRAMCSRIYSLVARTPPPPELNHTEAARVKKEHAEAQRKLDSARNEMRKLKEQLQGDYGPHGEFIDLVGKCFSLNIQHYVYQVCPFKNVIQKEGHSQTTVGNWKGFEDNYSTMMFSDGDHCWNGPSRSMKVSMECGMKTEILSVEEPSRCEYAAVMTTPAMCTAEKAKEFETELERRKAELASIHDEL